MICTPNGRLKTMTEVIAELKAIEAWESSAMSLPLDARARQAIARLQGRARSDQQAAAESAAARASRDQLVAGVRQSFSSWAELELKKIAAHIATAQIKASVIPVRSPAGQEPVIQLDDRSRYEVIAGCELVLETHEPPRGHALQLLLCSKRTVAVHVSVGAAAPRLPDQGMPELAVISAYARSPSAGGPGAPPRRAGFFNRHQSVGQIVRHVDMRPGRPPSTHAVTLTRVGAVFRPDHSLHTPFKVDGWNVIADTLRAQLEEAIGAFVEFAMEEHPSIGP